MKTEKIFSNNDGLELELSIIEPTSEPKGIIQISHGMAEHKERYFDFMKYMAERGYICAIHDHRGHGASVKEDDDLGFFYTENINYIVDDLYQVTKYIKEKYNNLDVILFSHSMGTLVSRNYLKKYDKEIKKIILCGPPTKNSLAGLGIKIAKIVKGFRGEKYRSKFLDKLTFGSYNKGNSLKNGWICSNNDTVHKYNNDKLCGYTFTINGFINLYKLMKEAFYNKNWKINNKNLSIFIIAGSNDPVIQNKKKFNELIQYLKNVGYQNIKSELYNEKRHELLNEVENKNVYDDIYRFIENDIFT